MSKRVLLTGISGFIGAHIAAHLLRETDWSIVGITTFRHKGDPLRLIEDDYAFDSKRVELVHTDLAGPIGHRLVDRIGDVDYVINAASESHVDRSIADPVPFVMNNVQLALTMLEYARAVKPKVFIQVSTDEVYGPAPDGVFHPEWAPVIPSNPYSASKAAQEALAISYWRTYGVPVVITNTMNNFGPMQDPEKFVSLVISKVMADEVVPIHADANGKPGSRFYLHARNHADALLFLLHYFTRPRSERQLGYGLHVDRPVRFNVSGDAEVDNLTLAHLVAKFAGKELHCKLVDAHSARPGHDLRYALDGSKLRAIGWDPPVSFEDSLRQTVEWTMSHRSWLIAA